LEKLQDLIKERDRYAVNSHKLEADILSTEQLVEIYSQYPDRGHYLEPLIETVDYRFRLVILKNHLYELDGQIKAFVEAGVFANEPGSTTAQDIFRVLGNYTTAHASDVTIHVGDKVRVLDNGLYDGWVHIKTPLNKEGFVPALFLEGLAPDAVLKGNGTCFHKILLIFHS
jgi:hypothetical protein